MDSVVKAGCVSLEGFSLRLETFPVMWSLSSVREPVACEINSLRY